MKVPSPSHKECGLEQAEAWTAGSSMSGRRHHKANSGEQWQPDDACAAADLSWLAAKARKVAQEADLPPGPKSWLQVSDNGLKRICKPRIWTHTHTHSQRKFHAI